MEDESKKEVDAESEKTFRIIVNIVIALIVFCTLIMCVIRFAELNDIPTAVAIALVTAVYMINASLRLEK